MSPERTGSTAVVTRMRGEDRRELIMQAAMKVFGDYGYVGATTAQIARAAGVSQPYVVQAFGTKEQLFLAVIERALQSLLGAFARVVESDRDAPVGPEHPTLSARLGAAYVDQLNEPGLLLSLMHAFVLGKDHTIGPAGRGGFMQVYRYLRDAAGFSPEEVRAFLAEGMLINTMIGLRMIDEFDTDADARELLAGSFERKLDQVRRLAADSASPPR
ncbi:TetR/AcrR family transcriptional regulator [Subtercola boreus]|uniref:HTH tetR-type domain-containing protein n=1 Tax=Subtercola boreus TaxID=120213 RepID=A0A3E0W6P9_9MICO|nr:TetR/AcrR family transcriptional regulator [Subtercola boreus]RFA17928.1 hypothetical protein B7R24_14765 [Subtercola boreus]RFA18310.1 hypothetical protein B7R23_14800 [Subtercola boreus]RFA24840.1 hypothetical protein B7R25_14795 [Subtercola boreus]